MKMEHTDRPCRRNMYSNKKVRTSRKENDVIWYEMP